MSTRQRLMPNNSDALYTSVAITSAANNVILPAQANANIVLLRLVLSQAPNSALNSVAFYMVSNGMNLGPFFIGGTTGTPYDLDFHDNPLRLPASPSVPGGSTQFSIATTGSNINIGGYVQYIQGQF